MPCRRLIGCQTDARGVSCIRRQAISAFRPHEPDHNRDNDMCAHESRNDLKALYLPVVTAMADRWAEGKILNPDSGRANGYYRMTGWLLNYVAEHHMHCRKEYTRCRKVATVTAERNRRLRWISTGLPRGSACRNETVQWRGTVFGSLFSKRLYATIMPIAKTMAPMPSKTLMYGGAVRARRITTVATAKAELRNRTG